MRFGKKLALQVMDDQSGAPYLSHKPMKEAINRTVRELRLYQAKCQGSDAAWRGGSAFCPGAQSAAGALAAASPQELAELEERVSALDRQLFGLVDEDLARILAHVRLGEAQLALRVAALQSSAKEAGVLVEEPQLQLLERALPFAPEERSALCRQLLELKMRSDPLGMAKHIQDLSLQYNSLVDLANQHSQYMEINVAGFRKLLKRHEKQIPQKFRSRPMPCLGFHRLVTHTSRQLLDLARQLGGVIADAWQRLPAAIASGAGSRAKACGEAAVQATQLCSQRPELQEPKGLGPECEMVLHIQRQLKEPMSGQVMLFSGGFDGASPGFLYPKPAVPARAPPAQPMFAQDQQHISGRPSHATQ
mmetsp:Transcript_98083/g.316287  ORF Transcript_98083/g.316287 Transcript_98083/m.316287 type:complete len:363 (-) Transcript_98083:370-1458(-)